MDVCSSDPRLIEPKMIIQKIIAIKFLLNQISAKCIWKVRNLKGKRDRQMKIVPTGALLKETR